jgi:hypothetical protein
VFNIKVVFLSIHCSWLAVIQGYSGSSLVYDCDGSSAIIAVEMYCLNEALKYTDNLSRFMFKDHFPTKQRVGIYLNHHGSLYHQCL